MNLRGYFKVHSLMEDPHKLKFSSSKASENPMF